MTDKAKILAEIERLLQGLYGKSNDYCGGKKYVLVQLRAFINSLPEEPVSSIWHESNEEPIDKGHCIVNYGGNKYFDFELCLYNKEQACFITEKYLHPTGYEIEIPSCEGNCVMKQYKTKRDKILLSEIKKWAYLDDLLHKKEEHVSEDLEEASEEYAEQAYPYKGGTKGLICDNSKPIFIKGFKAGAKWQKERLINKACEWLTKHAKKYYFNKEGHYLGTEELVEDFKLSMEI